MQNGEFPFGSSSYCKYQKLYVCGFYSPSACAYCISISSPDSPMLHPTFVFALAALSFPPTRVFHHLQVLIDAAARCTAACCSGASQYVTCLLPTIPPYPLPTHAHAHTRDNLDNPPLAACTLGSISPRRSRGKGTARGQGSGSFGSKHNSLSKHTPRFPF